MSPPGSTSPSPETIRYTPSIETAIAPIFINDFCSPKKSIMQSATMTGYMKLMVDEIPLAMFSNPMRRVMEVTDLRKLRSTTLHTSPNEFSLRVFFFAVAYMTRTRAASIHRYDRMSKLFSPVAISARLKRGENPNDADEIAA